MTYSKEKLYSGSFFRNYVQVTFSTPLGKVLNQGLIKYSVGYVHDKNIGISLVEDRGMSNPINVNSHLFFEAEKRAGRKMNE